MKKSKLVGKIFGIALVFVMVGSMLGGLHGLVGEAEASPGSIYVPDDYPTIQAAVDAASPGDTIIVRDGIYTENVDVNKDHLTIRSEHGADVTIVQSANPDAHVVDHVFEVTADYVEIIGFTANGAIGYQSITGQKVSAGIYLGSANYCNISDNIVSNNLGGIHLRDSSNNTLTSNSANSNINDGIYLYESSNNTLTSNTASNNPIGIELVRSSNNTLTNNTAWNTQFGIGLAGYSDNNTLTGNTVSSNENGILLACSSNNTLIGNIMSDNDYNFSILVCGYSHGLSAQYTQNIDTSNLVDGKPIYYWVNQQDKQIPNDAGFVALVNCTNITVRDLTLTNNGQGVLFAFTTNSRIENVTASNNGRGIYLDNGSSNNTLAGNNANSNGYGIALVCSNTNTLMSNNANSNIICGVELFASSNNRLTNNTVSDNGLGIGLQYSSDNNTLANNTASNNYCGIELRYSSNNTMYLNNFTSKIDNAYSLDSTNIWNSAEEITYTYKGNTYTSYLGNHWGDYKDRYPDAGETDSTGIWDTPYSIDSDRDNYPLVQPFENYIGQPNQPPNTPSNPSPPNHATGVSINADLSWSGGDPDAGDTVTYDVYFGTSATPPFEETIGPYPATQISLSYDLGILSYNTKYYWQIVARDDHGVTREGPIWDFTTGDLSEDEPSPELGFASLIAEGKLVIAYNFDPFTTVPTAVAGWTWYDPTLPPAQNNLYQLYLNTAYWVKVTEECWLTYGTQTYHFAAGWNNPVWLGC